MKHFPIVEHVMFLLSDQPRLGIEVLNSLVRHHNRSGPAITASTYSGQLGVPVIFSDHFFNELRQLEGDNGAKKIVMKHLELVEKVDFPGGEVDVDTEEDYDRLEKG